jgi:hypothetical protein
MSFRILSLTGLLTAAAALSNAQWLNYPGPETPLTRAGKPDLTGKTPRTASGQPDLSGVWQMEPPAPGEIERIYGPSLIGIVAGDDDRTYSRYFRNILIDFKDAGEPIRPEAAARTLRNRQNTFDAPQSHCLPLGLPNRYFVPFPFKIFQSPRELAMFFEVDGVFRQIHTDGRKLPVSPFPSWLGYSTGHWENDTLVVDTAGFNDKGWMDVGGHPRSEALHVQERFHRRDFGHMDIEAIVEDAGILTRPVTLLFTVLLIPNSDVLEQFCSEGERDLAFVQGTAPK